MADWPVDGVIGGWPDVVICCGRQGGHAAKWRRQRSGDRHFSRSASLDSKSKHRRIRSPPHFLLRGTGPTRLLNEVQEDGVVDQRKSASTASPGPPSPTSASAHQEDPFSWKQFEELNAGAEWLIPPHPDDDPCPVDLYSEWAWSPEDNDANLAGGQHLSMSAPIAPTVTCKYQVAIPTSTPFTARCRLCVGTNATRQCPRARCNGGNGKQTWAILARKATKIAPQHFPNIDAPQPAATSQPSAVAQPPPNLLAPDVWRKDS